MNEIAVYDLLGKLLNDENQVKSKKYIGDLQNFQTGIHLKKVRTKYTTQCLKLIKECLKKVSQQVFLIHNYFYICKSVTICTEFDNIKFVNLENENIFKNCHDYFRNDLYFV
jgi:hypothetical protein